jgi:putative flippase GtrA
MLRMLSRRVSAFLQGEKVRFVLVGLWNTGFGFLVFGGFLSALGEGLYWLALVFSHMISSSLAFVLYRRWVFRVSGFTVTDFVRFQMVYLASFLLNAVLLVLLVTAGGVPALLAQAACQVLLLLTNFLGHKYFSFARRDALRG